MILKKQSGAVLVISLIIVITLTLLVLSGTQSTLMQEKMTSAMREAHVSLEVAESGVKDAESMIENLTGVSGFSDTGAGGNIAKGMDPRIFLTMRFGGGI
ncbi:PilX N-terminal domain-containing pilus assembly protein [Psychromonas sp. MME2]|uniref:pilus assembly PilX family protein n=1 Tax=Psychromonas sp. MME2 TaxID=3231033 RepID=UPI00339C2797